MINSLLGNPLFMIGVVLLGIGAFFGLIIAGLVKWMQRKSGGDSFTPTELETLMKPEIRRMMDLWGTGINKILQYRYDEKGVVFRHLDMVQDVDKPDSEFSGETDAEVSINEDELETAYKNGDIDERTHTLLTEYRSEPVHILLVRPQGVFNKFKWFVAENIMSQKNLVSRLIIIPERLLVDDVDRLTVDKSADFRRFAGMDVAVESSAMRFVESIAFKKQYEQALESHQNYTKKMNYYDSAFNQQIEKLIKENGIKNSQWGEKNADLMNED